jgi:alpha-tubulin suppressor-like RCC1 family protein
MRTRLLAPIGALVLVLTIGCGEGPETPTAPSESKLELVTAAAPLAFRQVSAGKGHSCGVTTDDRVYCWGRNGSGELGDGTTTNRLVPTPTVGGYRFREVSVGEEYTCAITTDDRVFCWGFELAPDTTNASSPVAVEGGLRFRHIATNLDYQRVCGITKDDRAYCWGAAPLGGGTLQGSRAPVPVLTDRRFVEISTGAEQTCALTPSGQTFCWGIKIFGLPGGDVPGLFPTGGLLFRHLSLGNHFGCALTPESKAYCWGTNDRGQLGDGTVIDRTKPVAVSGGRRFLQVSAGDDHTCGVTTQKHGVCWGSNDFGKLGHGASKSFWVRPVPVVGGLSFANIDAGFWHTCAVTTDHAAYCWGRGQLGDGTTTSRPSPVAVAGPK